MSKFFHTLLNGDHIFALKYSNLYGKRKCKNVIKQYYSAALKYGYMYIFKFYKLHFFFFTKLAHKACNKNNIINIMVPGKMSFYKYFL